MKQIGELQNLQYYFQQIVGVISNATTKIDSAIIANDINNDIFTIEIPALSYFLFTS
jgi:hypothetical protein